MSVTYYYWRHHRQYEEKIENLQNALWRARNDVDWQLASPQKIVLEDGTVLEDEEILQLSGYYDEIRSDFGE